MSTSSTEILTRPDGSPVRVLVVDDEQVSLVSRVGVLDAVHARNCAREH